MRPLIASLHCPGSLREPNPVGWRKTRKTTDEEASQHPKTATGNHSTVGLVPGHEKEMLGPKAPQVSEFSLDDSGGGYSGEVGDEMPRLARTPARAATSGPPNKRKKECRKNFREKRQVSQADSEEEGPPSKKKRPRTKNQEPSPRPFACPSYRHNEIQSAGCKDWRNIKFTMVKQHCIEIHVKPRRCGRCRIFRAGTEDEIKQHLQKSDCEKSDTPDPSEEDALRKADEIEKAKTWGKIYQVLHPQVIPDPFYNEFEQAQANITDRGRHTADTHNVPAECESTSASPQRFGWHEGDLYLLQGITYSVGNNAFDESDLEDQFQTSVSNQNSNDLGSQPLEYWSIGRDQ